MPVEQQSETGGRARASEGEAGGREDARDWQRAKASQPASQPPDTGDKGGPRPLIRRVAAGRLAGRGLALCRPAASCSCWPLPLASYSLPSTLQQHDVWMDVPAYSPAPGRMDGCAFVLFCTRTHVCMYLRTLLHRAACHCHSWEDPASTFDTHSTTRQPWKHNHKHPENSPIPPLLTLTWNTSPDSEPPSQSAKPPSPEKRAGFALGLT